MAQATVSAARAALAARENINMDYGLIGGLAKGLERGIESYQTERDYQDKKKQEADELALKKRLAQTQELEAASKMADVVGYLPQGSFSDETRQAFGLDGAQPSQGKPQQGLVNQPEKSTGLMGQGQSAVTGDQGFLTKPVDTPFMPKHVREGIKEATQLSATNYGKGVTYKYDPDARVVRQFPAQMSPEHAAQFESTQLGNMEKREALKNIKPDQAQAALYGKRMQQAEDVFSKLEGEGYNRTGLLQGAQSYLPAFAQGSNLRRQDQAERNFVNAVLRKESGSAISSSEFSSAEKQYFPRPGDTPEVLEQKRANRALAINGMKQQAGDKAWSKLEVPTTPVKNKRPGGLVESAVASDVPKKGAVHDGYRFKGGDPGVKENWEKVK